MKTKRVGSDRRKSPVKIDRFVTGKAVRVVLQQGTAIGEIVGRDGPYVQVKLQDGSTKLFFENEIL